MYICIHNHTDHSNTRGFLDSTNKVKKLIEYARECGHNGIAITEHDTISSHMEVENTITALRKEDPDKWNDFRIILGNEIYLCNREQIEGKKEYIFPHFILLAKDAIGHKQIRELSTRAWVENSFSYVNIRTPTYYEDLFEVLDENPGHLIASTACLGGNLARLILKAYEFNPIQPDYSPTRKWIGLMKKHFGEGNFFLEMQPSNQEAQIIVNKAIIELSEELGVDYVISTDSHYLRHEDRKIHEAFLNSNEDSGKQRETGEFYATTYVMTEAEIHEYMDESLGYEVVQKGIDNTQKIRDMVEEYSLKSPLEIPYEPEDLTEPDEKLVEKYSEFMPTLSWFAQSETDSDRHMVREIVNRMERDQEELCNQKTYDAVEVCLDSVKKSSSETAHWSAYLLMTKDFVDAMWLSNSLVGPSRGSGLGFVLLYILDIIQINPLLENAPTKPWRFLNPERVSPLDIDIDFENSKRNDFIAILQKKYCGDDEHAGIRKVMKVQTLSTFKSKSAVLCAARGLGYPQEVGQFLSAFISAERGILRTLKETYYGNEEDGILPNTEFVNLMNNEYSDIWEVAQGVEGLITGVGSHAGGVIICATTITDHCALMKTSSGDIITQWDLHNAEAASLIKWDALSIDALEKEHICLNLLLEDGLIEWQGSLQATYEKYIGIYKIDRTNPDIWDLINNHKIISLFQMEKQSGHQAIAIGQPQSVEDLAALNSVMRLMAPYPGAETPLERYGRFRNDLSLWYKEMTEAGLNAHEQEVLKKHAERNYGLLPNQEDFMIAVQDPELGGFGLLWADKLRKSIA